jgi:AbrB family looped-hinge helix DNA binding protein
MPEATLSSKNQIVIPREAREALKIKAGDKVLVSVLSNRVIVLENPKSHREALAGIARGVYPKDYVKKERKSWK